MKSFAAALALLLSSTAPVLASPVDSTAAAEPAEVLEKRLGQCNVVVDFLQNGETYDRTTCAGLTRPKCNNYALKFVKPTAHCPCRFSYGSWFCACQLSDEGPGGIIGAFKIFSGLATKRCSDAGGSLQGQPGK